MILQKAIIYSIICLSIIYGKEFSEKKLYDHYRPIVGWVESSTGSGSGFLMNKDGLFVTAKHVVNILDTRIYIGGKEQEIEGIYWVSDPELDLIFFKINTSSVKLKKRILFEKYRQVKVTDKIITIGNPLNFEHTFSAGRVNNKIFFEDYKFILGSAKGSYGSSGGPVIKSNGKIIGMTLGAYDNKYQHILPYDLILTGYKSSEYWTINQINILYDVMNSSKSTDDNTAKQNGGDEGIQWGCLAVALLLGIAIG